MSGTPGVAPRKNPQVQDPWGARPGARGGPGTCGQGGGAPDSRRPPAGLTRGDLRGPPGFPEREAARVLTPAQRRARPSGPGTAAAAHRPRPRWGGSAGPAAHTSALQWTLPGRESRWRWRRCFLLYGKHRKQLEAAVASPPPTPTPRDGDPLAAEPAVRRDGGGGTGRWPEWLAQRPCLFVHLLVQRHSEVMGAPPRPDTHGEGPGWEATRTALGACGHSPGTWSGGPRAPRGGAELFPWGTPPDVVIL